MNKRLKIISSIKQKKEQQLEQIRLSNQVRIKTKIEKKKIDYNIICQKKDLHNIINSFLRGDVFDQDIFNQFWDFHFKHATTLREAMSAYNNTIIFLLEKIIQDNMKVFELNKQKQKHKQNHEYKLLNQVTIQIQQTTVDINQYYQDLQVYSKTFDFNFDQIIQKYKPYKIKDKGDGTQIAKNDQFNQIIQTVYEEQELRKEKQDNQLRTQQKYYRFAVYLTVVAFIGDLGLCYAKLNFIDLFANILLLLNGLFEELLFKQDEFNSKMQFVEINYAQNKLLLNEASYNPFKTKFYQYVGENQEKIHIFTNYSYSSMCLLIIVILWDSAWLFLTNYYYFQSSETQNSYILSRSMWKYNRYIAYASLFIIALKVIILILTFNIVDFDHRKLPSQYNFHLNFLRFTNSLYLNKIITNKQINVNQ